MPIKKLLPQLFSVMAPPYVQRFMPIKKLLPQLCLLLAAAFAVAGGQDKKVPTAPKAKILTKKAVPVAKEASKTDRMKALIAAAKKQTTRKRAMPKATGAMEAAQWRALAWRSDDGKIRPDGMMKARAQIAEMNFRSRFSGESELWVERGPDNVPGRTRALVISPADRNVMWTGAVGGGIWKTTDGGANWTNLGDKIENLAICFMAIDPANPNILYAGTGEGYFNGDAIQGSGILKSVDGGTTWNMIPGTSQFAGVNRIAISPTDSNRILISVQYGGLFRSTNGGTSFTKVQDSQVGMMVTFHPTDGNKAVATFLDYSFSTGQWFHRAMFSTNGGANWTESAGLRFNGFGSRIELAYAKSNPDVIFANAAVDGKIYRSTDGGATFSVRTTSGSVNSNWYNNAIWVDPTNENVIVVSGTETFRSTNGGTSLTQIGEGYIQTNTPHPDNHSITADPGFDGVNNRRVYICTDGGVYRTDNIYSASKTTGWSWPSKKVRTSQFYGAAGDGATGKIVGGTQDNGTHLLTRASLDTDWIFGGDGGWCAIDPTDNNYQYGEYIFLRIFRTTNGGGNANYITSGLGDAGNSANFIAPFVLDPNNVNRMFAGGASLWRSNNLKAGTPTWTQIMSPLTDYISAVAVAPGNSEVVWVGCNDGKVRKTSNALGTPTWTAIAGLPNRYVGRIMIDPTDSNKVTIGFGGFEANNLWQTTNGGTTWTSISGAGATALPSAPIRGIARHPDNANVIYVGTEVGILKTSNNGASWSSVADGPVNVSVDELTYMANSKTLLAATHGRGIWTLGPIGVAVTGPASLESNTGGMGTITINEPASSFGGQISLSSSSPAISVPATATISPRGFNVQFPIQANSVATTTPVTITATYGPNSGSVVVNVVPGAIKTVTLSPTSTFGGLADATGTVELKNPAPVGGAKVTLSSSNNAIALPRLTAVTVAEGATTATFLVKVYSVSTSTDVNITGSYAGSSSTAKLRVLMPKPARVGISPATAFGGDGSTMTGRVDLNAKAPAGSSITVNLTSATVGSTLSFPATVTVPAGTNFATFPITHGIVTVRKTFGIKADTATGNATGFAYIYPFQLSSVTVSPNSVVGGSGAVVTGTVTLVQNAPAGGLTVTLKSNTGSAVVPASVVIAAGTKTATFNITHSKVAADKIVTISAFYAGAGKATTLTLKK